MAHIKMKYSQLASRGFIDAVIKLSRQPIGGHNAYLVKQVTKALKAETKKMADKFEEQTDALPESKDEKEKLEQKIKLEEELGNTVFFIEREPLHLNIFLGCKLSAEELEYLEPLYGEGDE